MTMCLLKNSSPSIRLFQTVNHLTKQDFLYNVIYNNLELVILVNRLIMLLLK